MSIFSQIMHKIFDSTPAAAATPASAGGQASTATGSSANPAAGNTSTVATGPAAGVSNPATAGAPMGQVDVEGVLTKMASQNKEKLDWRKSIVDLMKLLKLDSSNAARKELATELGYKGDMSDSASMNIWLHKQVMRKLAENGGKVPDSLKS